MIGAGAIARAAAVLTRGFLLLYPSAFRNGVRRDLVNDVRRRAGEITESRGRARGVLWLVRHGASLVGNAPGAWADERRSGRQRDPNDRHRRLQTNARLSIVSWVDLKLALRMLVRYPGLTLVGGLGIAIAVAIGVGFFAILHSRFYPTIPLSEGDRLVGIENWDRRTGREERRVLHDFGVWHREVKSVDDITAFRTVARNAIAGDGSVEGVQVAEITPSGFRLARVPPLIGRSLVDEDAAPGAAPVIVIGFDVWASRFNSAADVVGRTLRLGRTVYTIVGVMPDGFAFPVNHRYWVALTLDATAFKPNDGPSIFVAGRLAPGVELPAAQAEITVIGKAMAAAFPDTHQHLRPEVLPYTYPFAGMSSRSADDFWAMSLLVSLLLVIVCVNVAVLVYARTANRLGEIAVRSALGATRRRIVAQFFAESLVLSAGASAVGLAAVAAGLDWARASVDRFEGATFWSDYTLSPTAVIYFVTLTVLAAVITGVLPALRATGRRVAWNVPQLSGSGLRMGRAWTTLIVVQVSVASAGVPIAVAMGWFQLRDVFVVPAFPVEQILFAEATLDREPPAGADPASYGLALTSRFALLREELGQRLDAEPGVASRAFTLDLPTMGRPWWVAVENTAAPASRYKVERATIDTSFLRTFDLELLAGRAFDAGDQADGSADVVLVDRAFAGRMPGGGDILGRRIRYAPENPHDSRESAPERWYEIVGVVENIAANPFGAEFVDPRVYHPMRTVDGGRTRLAVRVAGAGHAALARRLPQIAASLDPALMVKVVPLTEAYSLQRSALTTAAFAVVVAIASVILLSAAGVYALMSFTVAQRRREIAIRTALGAQVGRLLAAIFGRALRQIALGVAIGVGAAVLIDASQEGEALGGEGGLLLTATAVLMGVVGVLAALGPARRGLRIEPAETLKGE